MRWYQIVRSAAFGYDQEAVTVVSIPLYSNTALVSLMPTLAGGGTAVLMEKFDAECFLKLAQEHRATHAMLVPVRGGAAGRAQPASNARVIASGRRAAARVIGDASRVGCAGAGRGVQRRIQPPAGAARRG
jgi:hypothetical protein